MAAFETPLFKTVKQYTSNFLYCYTFPVQTKPNETLRNCAPEGFIWVYKYYNLFCLFIVKCRLDGGCLCRAILPSMFFSFLSTKYHSLSLICMIYCICLPHPFWQQKGGVYIMDLLSFILSITASVVAYFICKWLDRRY